MIIPTKKTHNPIVSVIVTTYNRQEYLKETIVSIVNQTFQDFEVIIVDNFSNYDIFKLIESFNDKRIKALQNNNNGIIAINRNVGIKEAQGKYLAFCDDDDIWLEDKLSNQMLLAANIVNEHFVIYTDIMLFNDTGFSKVRNSKEVITVSQLVRNNPIALSSVILPNVGNISFAESPNLVGSEDCDLWVRLLDNGYRFYLLKKVLVRYRVSDMSISNLNRPQNYLRLMNIYTSHLLKNKTVRINTFESTFTVIRLLFFYILSLLKLYFNMAILKRL